MAYLFSPLDFGAVGWAVGLVFVVFISWSLYRKYRTGKQSKMKPSTSTAHSPATKSPSTKQMQDDTTSTVCVSDEQRDTTSVTCVQPQSPTAHRTIEQPHASEIVAPGSDSSDVSTEGNNQREVPDSASAPDEQQPLKYDVTSTGDEGKSVISATASVGKTLSRSSTEIHHSSESGYDCVRRQLDKCVETIQVTKGAQEALTTQYIQAGWLGLTAKPSVNELLSQALMRMKGNPDQYDKFLSMLRAIGGLDLIVKAISGGQGDSSLVQVHTTESDTKVCHYMSSLRRTLYDDRCTIRSEFTTLVDKTRKCVAKTVDINALKDFVVQKCYDLEDCPEEVVTESKNCETVGRLFAVLAEHKVNVFFDIEMIKWIIKEYCKKNHCNGTSCSETFSTYEASLNRHLKRRVCEHPKYECKTFDATEEISQPLETGRLLFMTNKNWSENDSVIMLYKIERRLKRILNRTIELEKVYLGSLQLYFNIPRDGNEHSFVMDFDLLQKLQLINCHAAKIQTANRLYSLEDEYKTELTEPLVCDTWNGLERTEDKIQIVLQKVYCVSEFKDWLMTAKCFSLVGDDCEEEHTQSQKIQILTKAWHTTAQNMWWRLAMNLIQCCRVKDVAKVHEFMKKVAKYNHCDAPFEENYVLEVLGPALYERIEFQEYLKQHPNPWKGVAEVLYRGGEETRLNKLFTFVKSSEDISFFLSKSRLEELLQGLSQKDYKKLYLNWHSIPPPKNGQYSMMGLQLWLLTSSKRSWSELAWGLYKSFLDDPLEAAKREIINEEGEENFVKPDDVRCFKSRIENKSKLELIGLYLNDRTFQNCSEQGQEQEVSEQEIHSREEWVDLWVKWYPNHTKTVMYQALIYVGEHAAARSLLPSYSQDFVSKKKNDKNLANDILEVLTNTKSWPAFYRKLKSLHVTKKVADSDECSDITVYVKNHNPSWRDIARAAYCCGEEAVMQKVFKYIAVALDRDVVHTLITRHMKSREAFDRLYEYMRLPPLPENMPPLAGIDLWLLTCPCSWRELAWTFYRCQLPAAVIEVKEMFIKDDSFDMCQTLSEKMNEEQIMSFLHAQAHNGTLEDWMKSHPCLSWSVLISTLIRAKEKAATHHILRSHKFLVKGCLLTRRNVELVLKMFLFRKQEETSWKTYGEHFKIPLTLISDLPVLDKVAKLSEHWLQNEQFPVWWRLREILFNCCHEYIDEIRLVMSDVQEQVVTDAAFTADNIMDVLKKLKAWESFYFTVTGNHIYDDFPVFKDVLEDREKSLKTFMRKRPGKISWVDLAVAAYLCGEEDIFDQLSEKMRSPKDPTLSYRAVKVLLEKHHLSTVQYAGLNAELGVPLLLRKCSDCFGIRLWLLRDPSVTWTDLAVALYNLNTEQTDIALLELKHKYLPNTDSTFNQENLENIVQEIDEWKLLGFLIGDRNSQDNFHIFCTEQESKGQETCMMLIEWQKMHPYASWTLLYQALIKMNERVMSQHVLMTYLSEQDSTIPIVAMSCVFSGPPRGGKTTVVKRLKGEDVDINEITASTGVVDEKGVVRIDFIPSSNVVTDQEWVEMEEDDEVQAFLNLSIIPQQTGSDKDFDFLTEGSFDGVGASSTQASLSASSKPPKLPEHASEQTYTPGTTKTKNIASSQNENELTTTDAHHEYKTGDINMTELSPKSVLERAQRQSQQIRAARRLCKRHFLHLSDTGGQPEFRKMIALLIPRQSITFIVADMRNDFDSHYPVRYCHRTNDDEIQYSSFSIKDTINDIIEHIFCSELHSKVKSSIMFIGTHKDLIPIEKREEIIMRRNKELLQILEQCPHYHPDMVIRSDEMNIIFCVDNSTFETEHRCIRSRVMSICESERFQVKVKPEVLLLALTLKGAQVTVLPYDKCVEVAMDCGIAEEDVKNSLVFLHEKLMMIRVYELNEDETIVVVKPKALINKVSNVLKYMITRDEHIYSSPVVSYSKLKEIAADGDYMESDILIKVLIHLLIIAPIPKSKNETVQEFFVPSMFPDSTLTETEIKMSIENKPSTVPSIFSNSTPKAVRARTEPNQLLLSFKPFRFSIPSTLHAPVLCSLIRHKEWSIHKTSKTSISFSRRVNGNVTFMLIFFKECISLCLGQEWSKTSETIQQCVNADEVITYVLRVSLKLVGYESHVVLKHCLSCFEQLQAHSFADIHSDCSTSHAITPAYPENIWFSMEYRSLAMAQGAITSAGSTKPLPHTIEKVRDTIDQLDDLFSNLMSDAYCQLSDREKEDPKFLNRFRNRFLDLPIAKRGTHIKFFRNCEDEILEAKNTRKIWAIISRYSSYSNYELLVQIITRFCDASLKERMQKYIKMVEEFEMVTTVDIFLHAISASRELLIAFSRMCAKLDKPSSICSLYDIRKVKEAITDAAHLHSYSVYIESIEEG